MMIRPRRLRAGDRVHLVAPAGPLPEGAIDRALARVRDLGWMPVLGEYADQRRGYLAGTDAQRLADLQAAIDSRENDAIWCLRGGYGTMRLLTRLDFGSLRDRPRPLIGFSDNTALHLAAAREGIITFHGPHPAAAEFPAFAAESLLSVVGSASAAGTLPLPDAAGPVRPLVGGSVEGHLAGGNLSILAATIGTPFEVDAGGAILFIEEVGEPAYRVDRLLSQLLLAGILEDAAGFVVGAISECPDEGTPDLPEPAEVVLDRLGSLGVPVAYGLPFGHIPLSWTLPVGIRARLDASAGRLELLDAAVTE
jgi:muramoyltetrapeptide carboxypeptidase